MYKLREDVRNIRKELAEYINSPIWNYHIFFYDEDEEYTIQYREYLKKSPDAVTSILPTEEPEYSLSMGYEHLNTTLEMESDKITKSGVEELVPILSECEVTSEDKRECDVLICKNSPIFDDHYEIFFDSNNDDISSDDDAFEDIEYVEASLPNPEIVSLEEENDVQQEMEEVDLEDIFQIQDVVLHEKLLSINRLIADIESLNDNPTPNQFDLFLALDNSIPSGIENFGYDSEGDIRFLEELLINDSIPFPNNESFDFEDDPLFPRPPLEPPDVEFVFDLIYPSMIEVSRVRFDCPVSTNGQKYLFSVSKQIQTPHYPEIHPPSQEKSDEVFQAKGDLMKSIQTFLEEFNYIPFGEKPKILLQAWDKSFAIQHAQPEDSNELFQKLLKDLQIINKELIECNHPTFFDDNEDHSVQYKEYLENSSKEIAASNSNQEKEGPPQDSDMRQLIREEYCIEVCEEQRQNMENTMLELVKICQKKSFIKHLNTTPETKSDEIIKSGVEELVQILSENEVTSEDKRECDMRVCENSPICDDHSEIFSDSNNNDDISKENDVYVEEEEVDLEDIFQIQDVILREKLLSINHLIANIESLNDNPTPDCVLKSFASFPIFEESDNFFSNNSSPEFETFSDQTEETRSGSTTTHADNSFPEYDSFCFEIEPDQERLTNIVKNDIYDDLTNDPLLEEVDLFLTSDNSIPQGIENFGDDSKGDILFLEELLIDDSIPFPDNEASNFDNPSFPRSPPKPPDAEFDFELDAR
uniref:Reverse transcriptase domain-containing protein n=1 Tax=Tanacetum cinerariifolium TaxID=118510 RepID=A0A699HW47_TANCI|nr:hypothetical protein [Tanacetum cinerariifolium]